MGGPVLNEMKIDAIREIYNIAMGSASLAISSMIDTTVSIKTPQVTVCKASEIVKTESEQSVIGIPFNKDEDIVYIKLDYAKGISGTSVMAFSQNDIQLIVNKLMGLPMEISDDFEFDEMRISAVSEVMNQMMGAASTSMSQLFNNAVEISPPETIVSSDTQTLYNMQSITESDEICMLAFDIVMGDGIESKFITILSIELADEMAKKLMGIIDEPEEDTSEDLFKNILTPEKRDAIGEIQNIMMGSAATALSNFMNAKVWITTPKVNINKAGHIKFDDLDPSICVKIKYIKGIHGASVLVLKQRDVQMMVNQLMGLPPVITDDFEFDEMNISAVCEIMNQMMGASATTLSEIINTPTDISTPKAIVIDSIDDILKINNINDTDEVCAISFDLSIDGIMNSHFVTMLTIDLANEMADKMINSYSFDLQNYSNNSGNATVSVEKDLKEITKKLSSEKPAKVEPIKTKSARTPSKNKVINSSSSSDVKELKIEDYNFNSLEEYDNNDPPLTDKQYKNLRSLLDVPMEVTVRIGSTQKSIDEVGDFTRGTVIELETLANEPVDIMVNGNLIARGDVVVVDDNFAVRVTEIVK